MADQSHTPQQKHGNDVSDRSLLDNLGEERRQAEEAVHRAASDLSEKASELAEDAKEAALDKAEEAKSGIGESAKALGAAIRTAGDRLAESDQVVASKLALEAAGSLERLSEALGSKSLENMVADVRGLARDNPGGVFVGALLAGLALGRVLKTSAVAGGDEGMRSSNKPAGVSGSEATP